MSTSDFAIRDMMLSIAFGMVSYALAGNAFRIVCSYFREYISDGS